MPTIDDLKAKSNKKFKKSDYRPWNYMEEIDKESIGNQIGINEKSNQPTLVTKSEESIPKHIKEEPQQTLETAIDSIFRLTGHQKKIFHFVIERCFSRAMLSTGVIRSETLVEITSTTSKMIKTCVQRLVEKGLIAREKGKAGRGGFYSFKLNEVIRNAAIEYNRMLGIENNLGINQQSSGNQLVIRKEPTKEKFQSLPEEWNRINIIPLSDIGFKENHLMDIYETGLSDPEMVQESIYHFAYGIEYEASKYKQYEDFLNLLIGRLRKGKPWFEKNYRSPQEIAQQELLEFKKSELDRKKKIEEEMYKLAFDEWQNNLGQEKIDELATSLRKKGDVTPRNALLSLFFKENIWPNMKREYLVEC